MIQMATLFGARVIAIDRGADKLDATREAGAVAAFDFEAPRLADVVRSVGPDGISVAVDLVGSHETLGFCLERLGPRGRLVVLTTFPGVVAEVAPRRLVHGEISVLGSRYASRLEVSWAADLVATKRIRPVVSEVATLADVERLHEKLRHGTLLGRGAIAF
jgi:D-arabinose 1-dehydrogenase-like Zn-dependent alcohol dehydrogenase